MASSANKKKLFMCHQLAMKREAEIKGNTIGSVSSSIQVNVSDDAQKPITASGINTPVVWVLGGPGCGKGTQCEKIVAKYGFQHLSSGDLLRAEVTAGTQKGKELDEIMKSGKLVPNEDVLILLEKAIHTQAATAKGFLIDGYPREKHQGAAFEKRIAAVDLILYFSCDDATLIKRILGRAAVSTEKRADDNEETLKTRIATFRTNNNAILAQYPNITVTINAERPVEEIFCDVSCALNCLLEKKGLPHPKIS